MLEAIPVRTLIDAIKFELEANYQDVVVEGEISNLSASSAGHWYFTLSDEVATLSSALFKMDALRNPQIKQFKDGDKVLCIGSISVYAKRGTFQLVVKRIMHQGKGDQQAQFEFLKKKLTVEGLFDLDKKRAIPAYPKKVAIITAPQGAALQDFLEVLFRRTQSIDVVLIPSLVQGDDAPRALIKALDKAQNAEGIDVVVLARGGGSAEDLWAFNDEKLVRKIAACTIPVISAIGHQVDFSLSDFVSDLRLETPTAAAEVLSEHYAKVVMKFRHIERSFLHAIDQRFSSWQKRFFAVSPEQVLKILWQRFSNSQKRLAKLDFIHRHYEILRLHEKNFYLDDLSSRLEKALVKKVSSFDENLERQHGILKAMNPKKVLQRGYAFVTSGNGQVLSSKLDTLKVHDSIELNFHDGSVRAKILDS
ncbi:MAG: exodeoxyribonuclease VII large subunit [Bacteriovoracaceae bacterium]